MIERKVVCDICKGEIRPIKEDSIAVQGNIYATDLENNQGVGGGFFGGCQWLDYINTGQPVDYEDIPIHHVHIDCLKSLYSNKRA